MKGSWQLIAISSLMAIIAVTYENCLVYALFLLWVGILYYRNKASAPFILLLIITNVVFSIYYYPPDIATKPLETDKATFTGVIYSPITREASHTSLMLNLEKPSINVQVLYFPKEKVNIPPSWKTGATCQLSGALQAFPTSTNPGEFNYQSYFIKKGVTSQIVLENTSDLICEGENQLAKFYQKRDVVMEQLSDSLSEFTTSWLFTLFFGEDSLLDESVVQVFQQWNLSHLLAISGLHIGLITSFLYVIVLKTGLLTKEKAMYIIVVFLLLYPFFSGGAPSIWRASLMTIISIVMIRFNKRMRVTDSISIVFLLCLVFDKQLVYQLGFQFSFLVTFALLLSRKWLLTGTRMQLLIRISFISMVCLLPLQLTHFYYINPLALLPNIIFVPYFSLIVMPLLFILLCFTPLSSTVVQLLDGLFQFIHSIAIYWLHLINEYCFYPIVTGEISTAYTWIYYVILLALFISIERKKKKHTYICAMLLISWLLWLEVYPFFDETGSVTMLDVGQGDAIVLELPHRKGVIMIDAAGKLANDFKTPSDQTFYQVIKPFLYSKGINRVDLVILSHADLDHVGSFPYIVDQFHVKQTVVSSYFDMEIFSELKMKNSDLQVVRVRAGDIISYQDQLFQIISPKKNYQNRNDNSLVIRSRIGTMDWLFTGDISSGIEEQLLDIYPQLKADVLKVAHHGSADASSAELLQQLNPSLSLVSVGKNNRYNHPGPEVIERLSDQNIHILRTDVYGAIQYTYKENGKSGTFSTFLP